MDGNVVFQTVFIVFSVRSVYGDCENPQTNAILHDIGRDWYWEGEQIVWMTCKDGEGRVGSRTLTCQANETWAGSAGCGNTSENFYRIMVVTSDTFGGGSGGRVSIKLSGDKGSWKRELTDNTAGLQDPFSSGTTAIFEFHLTDVGKINFIELFVDMDPWYLSSVTVYDYSRGLYYPFFNARRIYIFYQAVTFRPNEGYFYRRCADSFQDAALKDSVMEDFHSYSSSVSADDIIECNMRCVAFYAYCYATIFYIEDRDCSLILRNLLESMKEPDENFPNRKAAVHVRNVCRE